jgi:hypothetical protein
MRREELLFVVVLLFLFFCCSKGIAGDSLSCTPVTCDIESEENSNATLVTAFLNESITFLEDYLKGENTHLILFDSSSRGQLLYDKHIFDVNSRKVKIDFECVSTAKSYSNPFYYCSIQHALQLRANLVMMKDGEIVSNTTLGSLLNLYPNSTSAGTNARKGSLSSPVTNDISIKQKEKCQLWWPLNDTDIVLHNHVPQSLSPLVISENYIFICSFSEDDFTFLTDSKLITIKIIDFWESDDCKGADCSTVRQSSVLLSKASSIFQNDSTLYFSPLAIESKLEFHYLSSPDQPRKKHHQKIKRSRLIIEDSDTNGVVGSFIIHQNVIYVPDLLETQKQPIEKKKTHTDFTHYYRWLTQIESRDDLGFLLSSLYAHSPSGGPVSFVEIGVNQGNYAELLLRTWPNLDYYIGIDTWKSWPFEEYYDIANYQDESVHDNNYQETIQKLSSLKANKTTKLLIRQESLQAVHLFFDHSLDVIYLDAMHHYSAVLEDLHTWWPKLKMGGLFLGHDYLLDVLGNTIFTIKPAVEKFAREKDLVLLQTVERECPSFPTWIILKTHE